MAVQGALCVRLIFFRTFATRPVPQDLHWTGLRGVRCKLAS